MTTDDLYNLIRRHKHRGIETEKMNQGVRDVMMSFESGEQTASRIYFPFAIKVLKLRGTVMKAIAGTNNGSIIGANLDGDSANGTITVTASDPIDTRYSVTPTTNILVGKDSYYQLTSAKATAGGRVLVTIEYERL